jgi:hypothetical protein
MIKFNLPKVLGGRVSLKYLITIVSRHTNINSIIAIHRLGGDAYDTWIHENGKLWLRDFLPSQITEARILTYGYDSVVAFSKSSAEVDDFACDLLQRVKWVRKSEKEEEGLFSSSVIV